MTDFEHPERYGFSKRLNIFLCLEFSSPTTKHQPGPPARSPIAQDQKAELLRLYEASAWGPTAKLQVQQADLNEAFGKMWFLPTGIWGMKSFVQVVFE